jgi:hypothetical protein
MTVGIVYYYLASERDNSHEMERITRIEIRDAQKRRELEIIRSRTIPCPIGGLNDARMCYIGSNRQCKWNELGERCDKV